MRNESRPKEHRQTRRRWVTQSVTKGIPTLEREEREPSERTPPDAPQMGGAERHEGHSHAGA
ncbi:hypothetical protein BW686_06425 [Pseudomonas syringae]|uniref:DUF1534 domain-containing protein n=1 Tax=Pseudomonas syringae TaxID=317 RepID=A0A244EV20_PSESX|nr:hypothetical protein BW686_06425 [Pseudomonas syringae]